MRILLLLLLLVAAPAFAADRPTVVVVIGAEGSAEYRPEFAKWADRWIAAAKAGHAKVVVIGRDSSKDAAGPDETDRDRLRLVLESEVGVAPSTQPGTMSTRPSTRPSSTQPLWLVFLGHGTYDGRDAKFNLRGPDVSDQELADLLKPARRPLALINCSSASAPYLNRVSGPNRIVIVATRSGSEVQFSRFGDYLSRSIVDPSGDLDKDGQTSLLEAYVAASHQTEAFYKEAGRLATEHALLDDTGDALGTPATWFEGTRATKSAKTGAATDGHRAHQWHLVPSLAEQAIPADIRARRDDLELQIQALRDRKATLSEADYYAQLEPLLLELARIYANGDKATGHQEPTRK